MKKINFILFKNKKNNFILKKKSADWKRLHKLKIHQALLKYHVIFPIGGYDILYKINNFFF